MKRKMNKKSLLSGQQFFILFLIWFGLLQFAFGQGSFDTLLVQKIEIFKQKYPAGIVFLHTDGDIYSPGENLYFKAYIKDYYSSGPGINSKNLQLLLIDSQGRRLINKVFPIENSRSAGKLVLDNSLTEGKYTLIGFTGLMQNGSPENVFSKEIYVKNIILSPVFVKLFVPDTVYQSSGNAKVTVNLIQPNGKPFPGKNFSYTAKINGTPFASGEQKSNKKRNAVVEISLPDYDRSSIISVQVIASHFGVEESNTILIPTQGLPPDIEFFPESGNLIDGLETKVGFTALDHSANPLEIKGRVIDANNKVISVFKCLSNGLGVFKFTPQAETQYKVEIIEPKGVEQTYSLPKVLHAGTNITFNNRTKDSLSFLINSNQKESSQIIHVIAEMDGLIVWNERINLRDSFAFKVPVKDLPGGIIRITLFDENRGVLAKRAVFLDKEGSDIKVETDRNEYIPGEEVNLNISAQNYSGQPVKTDMSIAVIDNNICPDWNKNPDILTWFLLGPAASNSYFPQHIFFNKTEEAYRIIDCLMLTLDEDKFNWEEVFNSRKNMLIEMKKDDFINKVIESFHLRKSEILSEIETDQFFYKYILKNDQLFPEYLFVNKRFMEKSGIKSKKPDKKEILQRKLASGTPILDVIRSIRPFQLMGDIIVFRGANSINSQGGALFVLDGTRLGTSISVLNSINPNEIENIEVFTNPIDIHRFTALNAVGVIEMTSKGGFDETDDDSKQITPYNSTLYWNPYAKILQKSETSVSFNSTKMKTKYRVVIQGVDETGQPVYHISYFQVY